MTDEPDRDEEAARTVSCIVGGCLVLVMAAAVAGLVVTVVGAMRG